jgi:hypothetical protein
MGLKKTLKKVAKGAALVGAAYLGAKGLGGKKKPQDVAKKYIGQTISTGKLPTGDAAAAANIALWDKSMKRMAKINAEGRSGTQGGDENRVFKKGGLVKSGKPKLAKRGWK